MENEPERRPSALEIAKSGPATLAITAINVLLFAFAEWVGDTEKTGTLLTFGANHAYHVRIGEVWRLVSACFLHIGIIHIAWNSYAGYGWCWTVERALGTWRFVAVYLLAGVGGSLASAIGHVTVSAGASGAMFGMIGAALMLRWRVLGGDWAIIKRDPFTRSVVANAALWTAFGFFAIRMDHFAHGGGLAVGLAATWIATHRGPRAARWGALAAGLSGLAVLAVRPGWKPNVEEAEVLTVFGAAYAGAEGADKMGFVQNLPRSRAFLERACGAGHAPACELQAEIAAK